MREVGLRRVKREWPHHVALTADNVMDTNYDVVHGLAND